MPKTIEVDFAIGDATTNEKGEPGIVSKIVITAEGVATYEVEVPPEAKHVTKALAVADAWFANVLGPHIKDNAKALATLEKLKFSLREALV